MLHRQVALKDLTLKHPNWSNPRFATGLDKADLLEFGAELKSRGIEVPLKVVRVKDGDGFINLIIDGQRRKLALDLVKADESMLIDVMDCVPEVLEELTPDQAANFLLDALSVGENRRGLSSMELVENAKRLRDANKSVAAIGKAIGRDSSWVSRMLTAQKEATPEVVERWKKGELPDELFKELASVKKIDQPKLLMKVTELRDQNEPGTARAVVLEAAALAKAERPDKPGKSGPKSAAVKAAKKAAAKAKSGHADKPKPTGKPMLEELVKLGAGRPIMDPYVKGLIDCAKYALGEIGTDDFAKPWTRFIARLEATPFKVEAPEKKAKAVKKARK